MNTTDLLIPGNLATPFDWPRYIREVSAAAPSPLTIPLVVASGAFGKPDGLALDLGAGSCNNSTVMLECGISRVVAVDSCPTAEEFSLSVSKRFGKRFEFRREHIQSFSFGYKCFDLINAVGILPYHGQTGFEAFIGRLTASLRPGGVLLATFHGENHSLRSRYPHLAWSTKDEIRRMLSDLSVTIMGDERKDGSYHAHIYVVFAKRQG